ncbi:hypothetical protein G4B88_012547 [Cannabis sativa]|uniref:RNase H type-1 domain-containing protein n=1 Tax=Cannabis sativa TaxID=3483 RepID=A0A7J6ERF4_CANSA|nr:hypothetical protein G4B88_012547 [Cannabis sativa]
MYGWQLKGSTFLSLKPVRIRLCYHEFLSMGLWQISDIRFRINPQATAFPVEEAEEVFLIQYREVRLHLYRQRLGALIRAVWQLFFERIVCHGFLLVGIVNEECCIDKFQHRDETHATTKDLGMEVMLTNGSRLSRMGLGSLRLMSHRLCSTIIAKSIWKSSRFKQFYLAYHRSDMKDFLIQALHNISKQDFPIFIAFVWQIWNSRNSILFNKSGATNNVEEFVVNYLQDYSAAQCNYQGDNRDSEAAHIPRASQHQHPPSLSPETPSLFVDAALAQQNGITGTGFIFNLGFQSVLASHYHQLPGAVSPIFAEGQAFLQSLKWCIDSQFSPKIVFSDCLNLVSKVNSAWQDNSALSGLVSRIRLLFSNFPGASLQFLPRQFNTDAHVLAKEALRSREVS